MAILLDVFLTESCFCSENSDYEEAAVQRNHTELILIVGELNWIGNYWIQFVASCLTFLKWAASLRTQEKEEDDDYVGAHMAMTAKP